MRAAAAWLRGKGVDNHMGSIKECGGPLSEFRVIEFAGLGPAPFCAVMLADMAPKS